MSFSQLSTIKPLLSDEQYRTLEKYLSSLSSSAKFTATNLSFESSMDICLARQILHELVKLRLLKYSFGLRCPNCGLLISSANSISLINKEQFCYNCDSEVLISSDDVEVIYTFDEYPFCKGQQSKTHEQSESTALTNDSLAQLLKSGIIDLHSEFFSPSDDEYIELQKIYNSVFLKQGTTKAAGDTLEQLVTKLFNLCSHFRADPIRLHPNQIDCYVRNTLYIPGISQANCTDSFVIECKNESTAPKSGYMNKLHSILRLSGKQFGVIVSKCRAPSTFVALAHQIFLTDKMIIISLDDLDLKSIILGRKNILECISRKIDEVKLNATKDLVALGLYDT